MYNEEKRNAVSMQDEIINPVSEYRSKPIVNEKLDKFATCKFFNQ